MGVSSMRIFLPRAFCIHAIGLTKRCSQPLAVAMRTIDFMPQFFAVATLGATSGGSAPSR
jgi:hypothetical protein